MIASLAPLLVAMAFLAAIVSAWLSGPIPRGKLFHDTGYDEKNPPSPKEWRGVQLKYTALLVFLGALFTLLTLAIAQ